MSLLPNPREDLETERALSSHLEESLTSLRAEYNALYDKIKILKLELKEQEQRNQDLLGIRNVLQSKLEEISLKAADRNEWQEVAMKLSKERDELQNKLNTSSNTIH